MGRFKNQSVLITGALGGFGKRLAERLYEDGANLVLSDLALDPSDAFSAFDSARFIYLGGDITSEKLNDDLVALAIERFGRLDIAYNNAGIGHEMGRLPDLNVEQARKVIDVDLFAVFLGMKYQLKAMFAQYKADGRGGVIINTSSAAGTGGAPLMSVYAAAKHGVVGLTRSAAAEYATKNIRVHAICPAYAKTPLVTDMLDVQDTDFDAAANQLVRGVPMKRLGEIDEIVEVMLFAADPKNTFMTGQTFAVDGGISAI